MDIASLIAPIPLEVLAFGVVFMLLGGFVKGAIGFALPTIAVAGLGTVASAQLAIVLLVFPAFVSNLMQMLREGPAAAWASLTRFWRLNIVLVVLIAGVSQFVPSIPSAVLFLILGGLVTVAACIQLAGWQPEIPQTPRAHANGQWITGVIGGVSGGLSGVWGPPVSLFLLAMRLPKREMVRVQGIAYFLGSCMLLGGHSVSGLLDRQAAIASAMLVVPAAIGMWLGRIAQDRLDQALFRKVTLLVLVIAGLNLLRRGLV